MTTAASDHSTPPVVHPRTRSMESWRARKAVMASRGEVNGPRVDQCDAALDWWRHRTYLIREVRVAPERAEALLALIEQHAAEAEAR